jgi:hypothetical protein
LSRKAQRLIIEYRPNVSHHLSLDHRPNMPEGQSAKMPQHESDRLFDDFAIGFFAKESQGIQPANRLYRVPTGNAGKTVEHALAQSGSNHTHHTKVHKHQPGAATRGRSGLNKEITGMGICMKKSSFKHLLEVRVDQLYRQLSSIDPRGVKLTGL